MNRRIPTAITGGFLAIAALVLTTAPVTAADMAMTCSKAETSFLKPAPGARSSLPVPMTVYTGCKGYTEVALVLDLTATTKPTKPMSLVRYCGSAVSPLEAKTRTDVWSYCSNALQASGAESYWIMLK